MKVISVVYTSFGSSNFLNTFIYHLYHSEAARGDSSAFGVFTGGRAASHGTADYHMSSLLNITTAAIYF
jgi:hypothetical protein